MPKAPATSSALSLQNVNHVLESVSQLTPPEKLLLYLKLPTGQPVVNPLKSPVNPLGSRFEITQTINWVRTHFVEDKNVSLPKQNIYAEYLEYCSLNNMKPLSTADFGKVMKQVFPEVRPRRLGTRGNSRYCYSGLGKSRSLSCPFLPEDLGEELEIKTEQNGEETAALAQIKDEKLDKHVSGAKEPSDLEIGESDSLLNGFSFESTKLTGVSGGDLLAIAGETPISQVPAKSNLGTRKRNQSGPILGRKDQSETKRRKQPKTSPAADEITNTSAKEKRTSSICDISSMKDDSVTISKLDLDISSDLNGPKRSEPTKINRSYSVELPAVCRTTSRTVSVDVISDYDLMNSGLETICNPFNENLPASCTVSLQDSGISSTQEPPLINLQNVQPTCLTNQEKNCDISVLNSFPVASQSLENKLPIPRLRPVKVPAPSQVAKIIILPSNVINQASWPQRQYKPIQPWPEKDACAVDQKTDSNVSDPSDLTAKDNQLPYDTLPKLDALGKDALDTYLNGEGNSQELDEELLQYFKPDFSSTEISAFSEQVLSLNHNDGLPANERIVTTDDTLGKISIVNAVGNKLPASKSSVPFYQPVSINEVHQLTNRCITEFQIANGTDLVLPSPSGSFILKRQASFDSGVRDLETPLNIPPSPNTRCKLFNFTPISPRPSSPLNGTRENSKSSCDTSIQSPFISPRNTPNCRTQFVVSETQPNIPPKQYSARLRSSSTSCKSNSLIGNPSPMAKKMQDLPSFNDLLKMSKPKLKNNQRKSLLPPISPLSTPDSPVFSFSEVRKDSSPIGDTKLFPTSGTSNGYQNANNFSSHEVNHYFSKDVCFNFDFYKNTRSKSVPAKVMSKNSSLSIGHQQDTDSGTIGLGAADTDTLMEKPFMPDAKSPVVESGDDNLDKMLTYYKEDSELGKNKIYLDVLNGESSFNSGDSTPLCNDNDLIVSGSESFSRRRDTNSFQSFLHSEQMPTPLDCLLGDVDIGLNGLSSDAMDVFSSGLPSIPID